jgi:hypothetical protein
MRLNRIGTTGVVLGIALVGSAVLTCPASGAPATNQPHDCYYYKELYSTELLDYPSQTASGTGWANAGDLLTEISSDGIWLKVHDNPTGAIGWTEDSNVILWNC